MGSRFLPATKASPKEMMPVVDKPLIQYAVEEAVAAGITDMVFITGRNKRAIEDHFDKAYEMETELEAKGKHELLRLVQETVPSHINCIYIRQAEPLGLGHAVLCAAPVVGDEPFAVLLADDLIDADPPVLRQMVDAFDDHESSLLGVQNVPLRRHRRYGIVSIEPGRRWRPERHRHRRKAGAGAGPLEPGGDRPLCADPAHLPSPAPGASRCRRRDPANRCHRRPAR
jgi:UTP--glucose-1-phosphate uridylyltransferase